MSSIAREKASEFKLINKGIHLAICDAVVDLGLQETPWGPKEQVWLRFEVPAERIEYTRDGEDVDEPQAIWTRYTKNLHKKSTLRQDLENWRGKPFAKEELAGFDLFKLVGKPCQIVVVHTQTEDRTYANVQTISECHKSQDIPAQELPSIRFSPEDTDDWEQVPKWLQKKFDERIDEPEVAEVVPITEQSEDAFPDPIPF